MSDHAKFGPSGLKSLEICPHYRGYEGSSEAADEGTMLHAFTETIVQEWIDGAIPNEDGIEKFLDSTHLTEFKLFGKDLSYEQRGSLLVILRHVHEELSKGFDDAFTEVKLQIINGVTFGTVDLFIKRSHVGIVRDWKFGYWQVDHPICNAQGWAYGHGCFELYPDLTVLDVGFLQPRVDDEVIRHTFTRGMFPLMAERIATIVERARQTDDGTIDDEHNLVPSNCKWCSQKLKCPPMIDFLKEYVPSALGASILVPNELDTPESRGLQMELIGLASSALEDMKRLITSMAVDDGEEVTGWEPVYRNGKKWIRRDDRIEAFEVALNNVSNHDGISDALREAIGDNAFNKLAVACSFTIGSLPAQVKKALSGAELIETAEESVYLKQTKTKE